MSSTKKPKFQYNKKNMEGAVNAVQHGMSAFKASQKFNVPRTTLRYIVNGKSTLNPRMGPSSTLGERNELMLVNWIKELALRGFPIIKRDLLTSVEKIVKEMNLPNKFAVGRPGKKWLKLFLHRHKDIAQRTVEKLTRNRAALTPEAIRNWFNEVRTYLEGCNLLEVMKCPDKIFNMDESGFMLCPKGEKVLGVKGQKNVYEICGNDKENITVLIGTSAAGDITPSLVVYAGKRLPKGVTENIPDGWALSKSDKGWITGEVFYEYIANVFHPWLQKKQISRPIILFLDGHRSHLTYHLSKLCSEIGIVIIALNPNATHVIQPLDVAVFGPLKKKWSQEVHRWKVENNAVSIGKLQLPSVLNKILESDLEKTVIINGFRKCGLYPFDEEAVDYSKCGTKESSKLLPQGIQYSEKHRYVEMLIGDELVTSFANRELDTIAGNQALYDIWYKSKHISGDRDEENMSTPSKILPTSSSAPNTSIVASLSISPDRPIPLPSVPKGEITPTKLARILSPLTGGQNVPTPFKENLYWPGTPKKKTKMRQIKLPAVVTSEKWRKYEEDRRNKKVEAERLKEERKKLREEKKRETEKKKNESSSKRKKNVSSDSSDSSENVPLLSEGEGDDWGEDSSESDDNAENSAEESLSENNYVVVTYNSGYFPGIIKRIIGDKFEISAMEKSGLNWRWPEREDILLYEKQDIKEKIKIPRKLNSRGSYYVAEMSRYSVFSM